MPTSQTEAKLRQIFFLTEFMQVSRPLEMTRAKNPFSAVYSCTRTCEQRVCMLLVTMRMHRSTACSLEDVEEKLAATLAVLHWVITLHSHQEGNQVGNRYWAIKCRVYTENKGRNTEKLGQSRKYITGLTCREREV